MRAGSYHLTGHAIVRYVQRVKPQLELRAARRELEALIELAGEPTERPPAWVRTEGWNAYLEISEGVALTLWRSSPERRWCVQTVLIRAAYSEPARADRNAKASRRRKRRRGRRFKTNERAHARREKRLGRERAKDKEERWS